MTHLYLISVAVASECVETNQCWSLLDIKKKQFGQLLHVTFC